MAGRDDDTNKYRIKTIVQSLVIALHLARSFAIYLPRGRAHVSASVLAKDFHQNYILCTKHVRGQLTVCASKYFLIYMNEICALRAMCVAVAAACFA